jgi:hypothetical protein
MLRLLVLLLAFPALAQADEAMCRNGGFASADPASFAIAKVTGAPRTYLRSDAAPCPNDTDACHTRAYVVPGDTVLTGAAQGGFVCALYPGKNGGSAGYVRRDEISVQPKDATPALSAWAGTWKDGDDSITLRVNSGKLVAKGEAYWPSADPSLKERPGGPNLGEMSGTAAPDGRTVVYAGKDADDCRVTLTLVGPYLVATDNDNCGGMNVTFTGVYQRGR